VQSGANRIRQIVLSLRSFSRLDESALKQADIHEGLESTLMILSNRLKATASRSAIEVIKAYENIPMVECYVSQLNQVFMSILVNAIDAIDGDKADGAGKTDGADKADSWCVAIAPDKHYKIALQTFQKDALVVIKITNNGPPIPVETSQRMFDPFFTTKPVGKGTGMGLAISYQTVVDLHGGTLEFSQTGDDKTVFAIEIPIEIPIKISPAVLSTPES
jgi:two-component system, NtrC family, sensor kinase